MGPIPVRSRGLAEIIVTDAKLLGHNVKQSFAKVLGLGQDKKEIVVL